MDLANNLLCCNEWDHQELHSQLQYLIPPPLFLPDSEPFAQARPLDVDVPAEDQGKCDVYIDNIIGAFLNQGWEKILRSASAIPLDIHLVGWPVHANKPLECSDLVAMKKLLAEGRLEEVKILLGWLVNTCLLTIVLPDHKYIAWRRNIQHMIDCGWTTHRELETIIGRLNHVGYIIPHACNSSAASVFSKTGPPIAAPSISPPTSLRTSN